MTEFYFSFLIFFFFSLLLFLLCHQKHSCSICVFALVVCFGVGVCLLCILPSPVWRFTEFHWTCVNACVCVVINSLCLSVQWRVRLRWSRWSPGLQLCAKGSLSALGAKWAAVHSQSYSYSGREPITNHCKVRSNNMRIRIVHTICQVSLKSTFSL